MAIKRGDLVPLTRDADAVAADILTAKMAYAKGGRVVGTMPNNAGDTAAESSHADGTSIHVVPAAGYYDGSDDAATITDADFVATNIVPSANIFGLDGGFVPTFKSYVNLVTNGNFTSTGAWSGTYCALTASSNVLSLTGNGANALTIVDQSIAHTLGHIYYIRATVRVTNSSCQQIWVYACQAEASVIPPTENTWYTVSARANFTSHVSYSWRAYAQYADAATASGKVLQIKDFVGMDLTAIYGAGNEPSQADIDDILDYNFPATLGWFDGTSTVVTDLYAPLSLTGDAAIANVLVGKTFYADDPDSKLTGTMPNNAGDVNAVSSHRSSTSIHVVPAAGYTDGSDDASVITDADFVSRNIKSGVDVFGLTGELENGWEYPSDWPDVRNAASDTIEIAFADTGTHTAAFKCTTSAGQYNVDWGDTTNNDYNSDALAEHVYTGGAGTACSRGYTTWKITITAASGNITRFYVYDNSTQTQINYPGYLAACFNTPSLTSLSNAFYKSTGAGVRCPLLEYFSFPSAATGVTSNCQYVFTNCYSLQSVDLTGLTAVTNTTHMFNSCYSLQSADISMMTALQTAAAMFIYCYSLKEMDTSAISTFTDLQQFLRYCYVLRKVTYNATLTSVTGFKQAHQSNNALLTVDISGMINVTDLESAFQDCKKLRTANLAGLTDVTTIKSAFNGCVSLETCTMTNIGADAASTDATTAFESCELLTAIAMPTAKLTAFGASGTSGKLLQTETITFSASSSFSSSTAPQFKIQYCDLSAAQLNTIFTDLPTATKTIDVTGCTGAATCDESIATAKNWTVTGA